MSYRDQIGLTGYSSLPYSGLGATLQTAPPAPLTGLDLIQANMIAAFQVALNASGQTMEFAFSDGVTTDGRIYSTICALWVTDETAYLSRHTHMYNPVVFQSEQKLMILASRVPKGARLYANDYLDIADLCSRSLTSYKIVTSILKVGIWTLTLNAVRTTPQSDMQ